MTGWRTWPFLMVLTLSACGQSAAPPQQSESPPTAAPAPSGAASGNASAPQESFIICPGDPRCPPR
ncbi:hypothetical protein RCO27_18765 [Sphingosinicella sp. LHD-64]|uniref:hypothetical protein n=1 Tax=Sphingosinicella sp. LHD-64 TaxID=3072139 RepID=UPI00280D547E|nr:hypothetical protein [Sphingosinicella sp. LHD-64]MDQ8758276.1 hypothetical protein [Sphingosinicella sp. LHD-64]